MLKNSFKLNLDILLIFWSCKKRLVVLVRIIFLQNFFICIGIIYSYQEKKIRKLKELRFSIIDYQFVLLLAKRSAL